MNSKFLNKIFLYIWILSTGSMLLIVLMSFVRRSPLLSHNVIVSNNHAKEYTTFVEDLNMDHHPWCLLSILSTPAPVGQILFGLQHFFKIYFFQLHNIKNVRIK